MDGNGRVGGGLFNFTMDRYGFPPVLFYAEDRIEYPDANYERYGNLKTFILKQYRERGLLV